MGLPRISRSPLSLNFLSVNMCLKRESILTFFSCRLSVRKRGSVRTWANRSSICSSLGCFPFLPLGWRFVPFFPGFIVNYGGEGVGKDGQFEAETTTRV